jgi:hypothetical protein
LEPHEKYNFRSLTRDSALLSGQNQLCYVFWFIFFGS